MPDGIEIRRLAPSDDRSRFQSGAPDLDRFFRRFAGQNQFRHHIGVTYLALADGAIFGYLTVTLSHSYARDCNAPSARPPGQLRNYLEISPPLPIS